MHVSTEEMVQTLMKGKSRSIDFIREQPKYVSTSSMFLVTDLLDWKDVLSDYSGSWHQTRKSAYYFTKRAGTYVEASKQTANALLVERRTYQKKNDIRFKKSVTVLPHMKPDSAICIYTCPDDGSRPVQKPHGNCKNKEKAPYYVRSKQSLKENLKNRTINQTPVKVYGEVLSGEGGALASPTKIPKSLKTVQNARLVHKTLKLLICDTIISDFMQVFIFFLDIKLGTLKVILLKFYGFVKRGMISCDVFT